MKMRAVVCLFIFLCATQPVPAQPPSLRSEIMTARFVIENLHIAPRPLNDSFSRDLFYSIMQATDSRQLFFTAAEFRQLQAFEWLLDDEVKGNGWSFYPLLAKLYQQALKRADSILAAVGSRPLNFDGNDSLVFTRGKTYQFATDTRMLAQRWERYLKLLMLDYAYMHLQPEGAGGLLSAMNKKEASIREKLVKRERRQLDIDHLNKWLPDIFLEAFALTFDPHTNYMNEKSRSDFQQSLSTDGLSFGIELHEDVNNRIIISRLLPGGPAWKSGEIHKGDELVQLQWERDAPLIAADSEIEEIIAWLNDTGKYRIRITIKKANGVVKEQLLTRSKTENEENIVKSFVLAGDKKIGYIVLPGFYRQWEDGSGSSCANDVAKEIVKLKRDKIEGLILDVRYNGGGSMDEAVELAGLFIHDGPVAGIKNSEGKNQYMRDPLRGTAYDGPLLILQNVQSASASELLAGALQDYNRAVIAGSNSFGKATMQQLAILDTTNRNPIPPGTGLVKVTTGQFFRLNGTSVQATGVQPDVLLPDIFDGQEIGEKYLPNSLGTVQMQPNQQYKKLPALPLAQLRQLSAERTGSDSLFNILRSQLRDQQQRSSQQRKVIPLNAGRFEKWRKSEEAEAELLAPGTRFTVRNNALDASYQQQDEDTRALNENWLKTLAADLHINESYSILCDLIKLNSSAKNQ